MTAKRPFVARSFYPWLGLGLSLLLTLAAGLVIRHTETQRLQEHFESETQVLRDRIANRIRAHEQVLLSAREFACHDPWLPSRQQWQHYVGALELDRLNPGVQAMGFAEWIPLAQLKAHVARLRAEGFSGYEVQPGGPLPPEGGVSSIVYIEPFDARNQRAFSRDMLAEALRREAMLQARDTGRVTLSHKLRLYQEAGEKPQAGTLLYAPGYRAGSPLTTVAQRREALQGWVYLAFRMDDLLQGILGDSGRGIELKLYDGDVEAAEALLFERAAPGAKDNDPGTRHLHFDMAGRSWTLHCAPGTEFKGLVGGGPFLVLLVGFLSSLGIFALLHFLTLVERRTHILAEERLERLQTLLNATGEAIYGLDLNGHATFANPACLQLLGYPSVEHLLGKNMHHLIHHTQVDGSPFPVEDCPLFNAFRAGLAVHLQETLLWRSDGTSFYAECWSNPQLHEGQLVGAVVTFLDISRRRQAAADLSQANDRLSLAARAGGVGIWEYDVAQNRLNWDDQMFHLYGITATTFSGVYEAWRTGLHPDDAARGDAEIQQALQGTKEFDTEFRVVWPDGRVHDIRALALVQRDAQGRALRMVGTNWDITERKREEQHHLATEERLAHAMAATGDGIWDWDLRTGHVEHNVRWGQILGFEEGFLEHPLEAFAALVIEEDRPKAQAAIQAALEGQETYTTEHRMRARDGRILWVLDRGHAVAWDAEGRPTRMVGAMADITSQKAAEAQLAESEAQFRGMFEGNLAPQMLVDAASGQILDVNPATEAFYGYSRERFLASTISLLNGKTPEELRLQLRGIREGLGRFESRHHLADGSFRWMEVHASPIRMAKGLVIYAIFHDITDRRLAEASLRDLNQTLEARVAAELEGRLSNERALVHQSRLAAMGEMVGNIAHQWRQPLNALSMVLANLMDAHRYKELTDERFASSLEQGNTLIQKMSTTITDFMDFFRPAKASVPFAVRKQVLTAIELVSPSLRHQRVSVALLEGPEVLAEGQPNEFSHVILNLVGNARDAIQETGGTQGIVQIEVTREGESALIRVTDNGGGIPVTPIERIFEPYFTAKESGTGLGLYMSKVILEQSMKGSIAVRNAAGGAEFSLRIPLAAERRNRQGNPESGS